MSKAVYFVHYSDDYEGTAICAESPTQARSIFAREFDGDYPDTRCRKIIDAPEDMPIGVIEDWKWCLKNGVYSYIEGEQCPRCGAHGVTVYYDEEKQQFYCSECAEEVRPAGTGTD